MAGQALAKPEDVSSVTAIMLCACFRREHKYRKAANLDVNSLPDPGRRFLSVRCREYFRESARWSTSF